MKKTFLNLLIAGLVLSSGVAFSAEQVKSERLDDRATEVNKVAKRDDVLALDRVSTETGIPRPEVESAHKRHPDIGPAGVLIAGVMADETKKPMESFMHDRDHGKSWAVIANENKVPVDKLVGRLDRLERAIGNVEKKNSNNNRNNTDRNKNDRSPYGK
jgi:hypothetical protein